MRDRIGRFHVITDTTLQTRWSHADMARYAIAGGADVVQLREKRDLTTAERVRLAKEVRAALVEGVQLIVNDRVDVAAEVQADGVHLGRHDLSIDTARRLMPGAILGGTANGLDEARRCAQLPLDYLGVGPVFGTTSKANPAAPLGLTVLAAIVREVDRPIVAIGGITPDNARSVLETGVHGIAVLSGVVCADDPVAASRRYRAVLDTHATRAGSTL